MYVNNVLLTSLGSGGSAGANGISGMGRAFIGARYGNPFGPDLGVTGHYGEFILADALLDSAEALALAQYQAEHFGITLP
jgi:hypothetical protein